jgi:hypothetical protein
MGASEVAIMSRKGQSSKDAGRFVPVVVENGVERARRARARWLAPTRRAFEAFWADPVSRLVSPAAEALVMRYFDLLDARERTWRKVHAEPTTPGSRGQEVIAPLAKYLLDLEGALARQEAALGIDPASRAKVRLETASTEDVLDRLFRRARGEEDEEDPSADRS